MIYRLKLLIIMILTATTAQANDGAYFASGNHLIPIVETDISINRERLTLIKDGDRMNVTVEYEFNNPGPEKTMIVGFEALPPDGDVDQTPVNGQHPYIHDFTARMNGENLPYQVITTDSDKYQEKSAIIGKGAYRILNSDEYLALYVYYFDANFKPGFNQIKHTYSFELSGSVLVEHDFDYVMTAANRWGKTGIGEFELILDMGPMIEFNILNTFFDGAKDWQINGQGAGYEIPAHYQYNGLYDTERLKQTSFAIRDGQIRFQSKNFKPAGELQLWVPNYMTNEDSPGWRNALFDISKHQLPFNLIYVMPTKGVDEISEKALRNYVFARRGYVFKNPDLQRYFSSLPWYLPDPSYSPDLSALSSREQEWYKRLTTAEE